MDYSHGLQQGTEKHPRLETDASTPLVSSRLSLGRRSMKS